MSVARTVPHLCALLVVLAGAVRADAQPAGTAPPPDWQQTVADLQRQIATLSGEVAALRQRVDQAAPAPRPSLEARVNELEREVQHMPELPQDLVRAGTFPGSIAVPDGDAALRIGGQARFTAVHSLGPLGTDDRFIASSIPVNDQRAGEAARTNYIATPTRLNLDIRWPEPFGGLRAFVETDFAGTGSTERLRHGYIQSKRLLFGQTWSTFSDPEVDPVDIDFEGLNAISRLRQVQMRYTRPLSSTFSAALAVENPAPDLSGAQGVNLTPDFVGRIRWEPNRTDNRGQARELHIQAAVLARQLRGELQGQAASTVSTDGFGVNLSGVLAPRWASSDRIKFASYGGWGIGRYITDLGAEGGQDAVYDPATNQLRALPVASGYIGYEHHWTTWLLSTLSYGVVKVDNLDIQSGDALRLTQRYAGSLTWSPVSRADIILEFLGGQRENKDRARGHSTQVQAGWKVRF